MNRQTLDEQARDVGELAKALGTVLAGKDPHTIGAALADVTASWIACHIASANEETDRMQGELLAMHIEATRALIPVNARLMRLMEEPDEPKE